MAQNITLLGASYSDVPSVELPKTGGGTAQFDDTTITSNAASASDIANGKLAFVNGELVTGTASGGGATLITKSITANGTYNASSDNADGYSSVTVNVSGGGGGGDMGDPIRFFDYDGTLVASYSSVPSALPSVPTHTGLTNGTWNYTLQEVTTQFNAMGTCDVGANYETVSGATEIDIELQEGRLHPYLSLAVNGEVSIDWGDNSTSTVTGTTLTTRLSTIHHEYAAPGSYTIKITKTSGTNYALYCSSTYPLLNNNNATGVVNRIYSNRVKAVRIGVGCVLGAYAFQYCGNMESVSIPSSTQIGSNPNYIFGSCYSLRYVTIPTGVSSTTVANYLFSGCYALNNVSIAPNAWNIGANLFNNCYTLESVSIPSSAASIRGSMFNNCYLLKSLIIPSSVASIEAGVFSNCYSLTHVEIPSDVTSIGNSAFSNSFGIKEYHIRPTTPPTLGTSVFNTVQRDYIIYVPASKLNDYKTAENWSTYASYMVGE